MTQEQQLPLLVMQVLLGLSLLISSTRGFAFSSFGGHGFHHHHDAAAAASKTTARHAIGEDYLSSLSGGGAAVLDFSSFHNVVEASPPPAPSMPTTTSSGAFLHAPNSYFDPEYLTSKGPRANADVGEPHDASRPLVTDMGDGSSARVGSWWCAAGGWPSPKLRTTTEIFYVFSGRGCLTDLDGTPHEFSPGDTVILPKGWSGRWDVYEAIHKVWVVNDHPHVEEDTNASNGNVIRVVITSTANLVPPQPSSLDNVALDDAMHGSPAVSTSVVYHRPSTKVGGWTCTAGSFPVTQSSMTECFHVLEGVFFLTNADGSTSKRCVAGDTVAIPKGWTGYYDIIEPVTKIWVAVE
jgi:uncharacterized cupin superfamily protein